MSTSPEQKAEMLVRVTAFLDQHIADLANPAMRADQAMLAETELYDAIPEKLRRLLDRSGPHEIYERLRKGCPVTVDHIYKACRENPAIHDKVLMFWDAMKSHEEMAAGEDEADYLPGEAEDENRVPMRHGGSQQASNPKAGAQTEEFEPPQHDGVAGYCEEMDMPATHYDDPVEPPADEEAAPPDPEEVVNEADFGTDGGGDEEESEEEV